VGRGKTLIPDDAVEEYRASVTVAVVAETVAVAHAARRGAPRQLTRDE